MRMTLFKEIPIPKDRWYSWSRVIFEKETNSLVLAFRLRSKSTGPQNLTISFNPYKDYLLTTVDQIANVLQIDSLELYSNDCLVFQLIGINEIFGLELVAPDEQFYLTYMGNRMMALIVAKEYKLYRDIKVI